MYLDPSKPEWPDLEAGASELRPRSCAHPSGDQRSMSLLRLSFRIIGDLVGNILGSFAVRASHGSTRSSVIPLDAATSATLCDYKWEFYQAPVYGCWTSHGRGIARISTPGGSLPFITWSRNCDRPLSAFDIGPGSQIPRSTTIQGSKCLKAEFGKTSDDRLLFPITPQQPVRVIYVSLGPAEMYLLRMRTCLGCPRMCKVLI